VSCTCSRLLLLLLARAGLMGSRCFVWFTYESQKVTRWAFYCSVDAFTCIKTLIKTLLKKTHLNKTIKQTLKTELNSDTLWRITELGLCNHSMWFWYFFLMFISVGFVFYVQLHPFVRTTVVKYSDDWCLFWWFLMLGSRSYFHSVITELVGQCLRITDTWLINCAALQVVWHVIPLPTKFTQT